MVTKRTKKTLPAGIRRNNPGNLRAIRPNYWKHQSKVENGFAVFETMYFGCRALCKLLRTYFNRGWLKDAKTFVNHYAPASDGNNVNSYVNYVSSSWDNNKLYITQLVCLIVCVECGENYLTNQMIGFFNYWTRHFFTDCDVSFDSSFDYFRDFTW